MHRIDPRAVWAALFFSLALAACDGSGSTDSSASPSANSQPGGEQSNPQDGQQNSQQNSQQMAGTGANANASAEDNAPGAPDMHWAPNSSANAAH